MSKENIKICIACNSEFNQGKGKNRKCSKCRMEKFKDSENYEQYLEKSRASHKKYMMKKLYGITQEQFNVMLEEQEGKCAICFTHQDELVRRMNIDHDHNCCPGKETCGNCIRGLLCGSCNMALGAFKDNKVLLERAIEYVERFGG